jgi:hypothetical protein
MYLLILVIIYSSVYRVWSRQGHPIPEEIEKEVEVGGVEQW